MSTLATAADFMNGELHGADHPFNGVSTDTRSLQEGELFVALQGPNFDGCDYVGQARDKDLDLLVATYPPVPLLPDYIFKQHSLS